MSRPVFRPAPDEGPTESDPSPATDRRRVPTVTRRRGYRVLTAETARSVAGAYVSGLGFAGALGFGLPEVDDRYHIWRVPLIGRRGGTTAGEIVIDAYTGRVDTSRSTRPDLIPARLAEPSQPVKTRARRRVARSPLGNTIALGDAEDVLASLPAEAVDLVFTSPPYFNARPGYSEFATYADYLDKLRRVIHGCHRVLSEGRFFVINISPVLLRRRSRGHASQRLAVPFDVHALLINAGFEFVDDIIWVKPEGAGWATGRGRRFAADRQPLQYKPVPVTEYVLVYRKRTDRLIDWHLRTHPDPALVKASRIGDDYERTNVWRIKPAHSRRHPAVFPFELAARVIRYYSFREDVVLDPFAGLGTTGAAASGLGRRFVLIEREPTYVEEIRRQAAGWDVPADTPISLIGAPKAGAAPA
ncbi:MAG TPA: site-specific DNA-methyltransferase [Dehalococcoidia bacterium]|nr:site-specific DNA-methyltransferase [Dehalococcoidia bacterium]